MKIPATVLAEKENRLEILKNKKEQLESDLQDLEDSDQKTKRKIKENEEKLNNFNALLSEILNAKIKLGKNLALNLFIVIILLIIFFAANQMITLYIALFYTIIKSPEYLSLLIKIGITKEKKLKKEISTLKQNINNLNQESDIYYKKIVHIGYLISDIETEINVINDIKAFIFENYMAKEQGLTVEPEQELMSGIELKRMKPFI